MLKNLFVLICAMGLTACAGDGNVAFTFVKTGEVAGTAGLEVASSKCAALEGSREWQACVAHYDGLYTRSNGTIKRSYALSTDAPEPTGQIEKCSIKETFNSKTGAWSYSGCEPHK